MGSRRANGKTSEPSDATSKIFAAVLPLLFRASVASAKVALLRNSMSAIAWRSGAPIDVETRRYHLSTAFTHGGRDSRVKVSPPTAEENEVTKRRKQRRNKTDAVES